MKEYIRQRTLEEVNYVIATEATIRRTAREFGISKTTVYKDLTVFLPEISQEKSRQVKKILDKNKAQRSVRGGKATKRKYQMLKEREYKVL